MVKQDQQSHAEGAVGGRELDRRERFLLTLLVITCLVSIVAITAVICLAVPVLIR